MRRFLGFCLALALCLLIAAALVPFFVPADRLKNEILAQIETRTGRKVGIEHVTFSLFPALSLNAEGVTIANPAWAGGGDVAKIKRLKLGLELFPLLHKRIHLKELTLEQPVLLLVKQHGLANWDFSAPHAENDGAAPAKPHASRPFGDLHLNVISVKDGSAVYKDDASPQPETITHLEFTLKAPNLSEKADIRLSMLLNGQKTDLTLAVDHPTGFISGEQVHVDLKAGYGAYDFTWDGAAALQRGIPSITGKITIPSLNVANMPQSGAPAGTKAPADPAAQPQNASRWSDAPLRLEGLARANADLSVSIGSLTLPKTTLKDMSAALKLQGGALQLEVSPVNAYGGTVRLSLTANTAGAMHIAFAAAGAEAEPLLHDFAGYDRLSGTIDLSTALSGTGISQRALVGSLGGSGSVHFKDGKLRGVNLPGLLRKLTSGAQGDDEGTDFSELSGTFTVAHGIIATNDLKMHSPLLRVTGAGTADLPNWQEHFVLKPMLVASLEGQGGKDAGGIVVPVKVEGPLNHPRYQPDFASALQDNLATLKDPGKLKEGIKDIKKNLLQGGGLHNLLR